MSGKTYALITPSFRLDLDRCAMLVESVERWVTGNVRHYLIIDRRDVSLFTPLASSRTSILVVEDVLPGWLFRIPGIRRFWFSWRALPTRNWILQQIVKLSIPSAIQQEVLLYVDSDVFFVRPYDPASLERNEQVPLFVERNQRGLIKSNDEWHRVAATLLGLPAEDSYDTNYIGNVVCWTRANALALQDRVASNTKQFWQLALMRQHAFSEYIIYGMFSQRVLGPKSGHWEDGVLRTLNYWDPTPLGIDGLRAFKARLSAEHHSVMISAKSGTSVADIKQAFFQSS